MRIALKYLPYNSDIAVTLVLASIDCFSIPFESFVVLGLISDFFDGSVGIWGILL